MREADNPPVSEFESPKLKIAGKLHLFKPNTGFTVEANNKSIQKKGREIVNLRMVGDSMLDKERETQIILKPITKVWCLYIARESALPYPIWLYLFLVVKGLDFAFIFEFW